MAKSKQFIVVWDDNQGVCAPMGWCDKCEGAIEGANMRRPAVAVFPDPPSARRAIRISIAWNELLKAQGKIHDSDFDPGIRTHLHIVPLAPQPCQKK